MAFDSLVPPPPTGMKRPQRFAPDGFLSPLPALRPPLLRSSRLLSSLRHDPPSLQRCRLCLSLYSVTPLHRLNVQFLAIASSSRPSRLPEVVQIGREIRSSCRGLERVQRGARGVREGGQASASPCPRHRLCFPSLSLTTTMTKHTRRTSYV